MHEINWKHLRLYSYQYLPFTALDNVTTQKHECKIDSIQQKRGQTKRFLKKKDMIREEKIKNCLCNFAST